MTAKELLNLWVAALNNHNLKEIVDLYNLNANLVTTFSDKIHHGENEIEGYFDNVFKKPRSGVALDDDSIFEYDNGEEIRTVCGYYTFQFEVDGELQTFPSRYTFVYSEDKIVNHHSSMLPGM